jgi:Kae1-associated kinase Bud32
MIYVLENNKIVNVKNNFKQYSKDGYGEDANNLNCNVHNKTSREAELINNASLLGRVGGNNSLSHNFQIFFIDFGLSFHSQKYEDKAVDIHLIKQALEAKHFKNWEILYKEFIKGYSKESKDEKLILKQLEQVEKRGRYKEH